MSIRPLTPNDITGLAAGLAQLPLLRRYGRSKDRMAADLAQASGRGDGLLVDEVDGRPCGLCWYLPSGGFGLGSYLKLLAVTPEALGRGVGARLLSAFESAAAEGVRHTFLLVSDFNLRGQRFYERHGYARVGAFQGLVLPDVTELLYWKRLP